MIVKPEDKTDYMLRTLIQISDESFKGIDRPPHGIFKEHFDRDDVFVRGIPTFTSGFAIVTERGGCPYLWSIAVRLEIRGQGAGRGLLDEIETHYRQQGAQRIELTCKIDNPAQKLYFDAGYRAFRVAPRYYQHEGDGLMMRRVL